MSTERTHLQRQLLARLEAHPPSTWPNSLVKAVIAMIDARFEQFPPPPMPSGKPRLKVVCNYRSQERDR